MLTQIVELVLQHAHSAHTNIANIAFIFALMAITWITQLKVVLYQLTAPMEQSQTIKHDPVFRSALEHFMSQQSTHASMFAMALNMEILILTDVPPTAAQVFTSTISLVLVFPIVLLVYILILLPTVALPTAPLLTLLTIARWLALHHVLPIP